MRNPDAKWSDGNLETHLYIRHEALSVACHFDPYLYQTPKYLDLQHARECFSFFLFRNGQDKAAALIHFTENAGFHFISHAGAPFGGIQCEDHCSERELRFLLFCAETWILKQNTHLVSIKTAPLCYSPETKNILAQAYKSADYEPISTHINHHINVAALPFCEIIAHSERRRLLKCRNAGFQAGIYKDPDVQIVYDFIKESRDNKKYPLSLTIEQLRTLSDDFPQQYLVFAVTDNGKIIALSLTVRVHAKVLYNFLPADLSDYQNYSPMVLLNEAIYKYCQKEEIGILDLGISLDHHGIEKPGLIRFKKNLGGQESLKITYRKKLG